MAKYNHNQKKKNVIQCIHNGVEKQAAGAPKENAQANLMRGNGILFIRTDDCYQRVFEKDILYIEADGSYCTLHFTQGNDVLISSPLGDVEVLLTPAMFRRSHRSYLVNMLHIERLYTTSVIVAGEFIPVSKNRKKEFFAHLNILSFGKNN